MCEFGVCGCVYRGVCAYMSLRICVFSFFFSSLLCLSAFLEYIEKHAKGHPQHLLISAACVCGVS